MHDIDCKTLQEGGYMCLQGRDPVFECPYEPNQKEVVLAKQAAQCPLRPAVIFCFPPDLQRAY